MSKILDYFRYPSTYKGIVTLLTALGVAISPEQSEAIAIAGVAIFGAIETFFSDADVKKK